MTIEFDSVLLGIMWKTILEYFTLISVPLSTVLYTQLYTCLEHGIVSYSFMLHDECSVFFLSLSEIRNMNCCYQVCHPPSDDTDNVSSRYYFYFLWLQYFKMFSICS